LMQGDVEVSCLEVEFVGDQAAFIALHPPSPCVVLQAFIALRWRVASSVSSTRQAVGAGTSGPVSPRWRPPLLLQSVVSRSGGGTVAR
jgi:hypothetical protein